MFKVFGSYFWLFTTLEIHGLVSRMVRNGLMVNVMKKKKICRVGSLLACVSRVVMLEFTNIILGI